MRRPPPLNTCLAFPITTSLSGLAILATLMFWNGSDISNLMIGPDDWWRDPWRFFTPVLFHGNLIHIGFNLIILWIFGTQIESTFGPAKTLGIYSILAAGPMAAEFALFQGGIGLSGIGYGLFGLLWILSRTDPRFRDAIDKQTIQWLVGWFFFCILTTITNLMPVANVAHGMGCVLGALLGWTISASTRILRLRNATILALVFLPCIAGATVARPYVNLSQDADSLAKLAYTAVRLGDYHRAIVLYSHAIELNPNRPGWWHNLGYSYHELGKYPEASQAFEQEEKLRPTSK